MSGFKMTTGSKAQVFHGTAKHTSGNLEKKDLMKNKHGRIVSKRKHTLGKTKGLKALKKAGWFTRKGEFGAFQRKTVKKGTRKRKTGKRR